MKGAELMVESGSPLTTNRSAFSLEYSVVLFAACGYYSASALFMKKNVATVIALLSCCGVLLVVDDVPLSHSP